MSLEAGYASLRSLELTDEEVHAVLACARQQRRSLRRPALVAATCLALMAGGVAAGVPTGRAELADALRRFFAGGDPPGRPVAEDELPRWAREVQARGGTRPYLLARSGDERLLAYRSGSGDVCFDFGGHVGFCTPYDDMFDDGAVVPWGPTHRDEEGRWVLWGTALDSVKSVELRYEEGPSTRAAVTNGFVLRVDAGRAWTDLVAFGENGQELASVDVRERFRLAPVGG